MDPDLGSVSFRVPGLLAAFALLAGFAAALLGSKPGEVAAALASIINGFFILGAAALAWFSVQSQVSVQRDNAAEQLRFSLYEKRLAILLAVKAFVKEVVNDSGADNSVLFNTIPLRLQLGEAVFFFPVEFCNLLRSIEGQCQCLMELHASRRCAGPDNPMWYSSIEAITAATIELSHIHGTMWEMFRPEMEFPQLTRSRRLQERTERT